MSTQYKQEFTVDESKWRCGGVFRRKGCFHGEGETMLRNDEGFKCCLGFAAQQFGYKKCLTNEVAPGSLGHVVPGLTIRDKSGKLKETEFTRKAIRINDAETIPVKEKKRRLIALGKRHGIKINFVKSK